MDFQKASVPVFILCGGLGTRYLCHALLIRNLSVLAVLLGAVVAMTAQIPTPLPGNPGNVFLEGQTVSVQLPSSTDGNWRAFDSEMKVVAQGRSSGGRADLDKLGVGFYRVEPDGASGDVALAVLAPLPAPTPGDSPIGVQGGPWIESKGTPDQWRAAANLMALAGLTWVRTNYLWRSVQPQKAGPLVGTNSDQEMTILHDAGMHVLAYAQGIPGWTTRQENHLPEDLRDPYNFYREIAKRWAGEVDAIEPFNEGDSHLGGAEIASYQKATYLGAKAGNPNLQVGSNAWTEAMDSDEMREFQANDGISYCDTFNFHHYQPLAGLPDLYARARSAAEGKPLWVTEINLAPRVPRVVDPVSDDPAPQAMLAHANTVAKSLAISLFLNPQRSFYFIFTDYAERGNQFGVLRPDLTPRPDYVVLAAVGRLLAGAKPIGEWRGSERENPAIYAFRAVPDGTPRDVLVAWGNGRDFRLPINPLAVYDHFGRRISLPKLSEDPVFIVLPAGTVQAWASGENRSAPRPKIEAPPAATTGQPTNSAQSPVVLQAVFRDEQLVRVQPQHGPREVSGSRIRIESPDDQKIKVFAYNFSNQTLQATISAQVPNGWRYQLPSNNLTLPPMGRVPIAFSLQATGAGREDSAMVKIRASIPQQPDAVVAFQVVQ